MKIKNYWHTANTIVRENIIPIIAIFAIGFWLFGKPTDSPQPYLKMAQNDMAKSPTSNRMTAKMTLAGQGGGGQMMAEQMMIPGGFGGGKFPPYPQFENFDPNNPNRKIIKNANLAIEVNNTETAKKQAEEKIISLKGTITHLNSWEARPGTLNYNFTVRIPSENLESAVKTLATIGLKKSEGFSTQDITGSYTDTENQLENLRTRRERLRELMKTETKELKDILEVDRELSQVQGRIENLERIQKGRNIDTAYSTLNLMIQAEPEIGDFVNPQWSPEKSWKNAVNKLIQTSQNIFDKTVEILTFIPIWLPILILALWIKHKFFKKK